MLLLLLLAPGLCLAGEGRRALLAEEGSSSSSRGERIAAELGLGLVTGGALGLGGGLLGYGLCEGLGIGDKHGFLSCLGTKLVGVSAGVLIGTPLGVWWGGDLKDGNGTLLATYLGMGAGVLVGATAAALSKRFRTVLVLVAIPVLLLTGAIVGYELSHREPPPAMASATPRMRPALAVSSHGMPLVLGGRF